MTDTANAHSELCQPAVLGCNEGLGPADQERAAFEDYYSDGGKWPAAVQRQGETYRLLQAAGAWETWKACAAAERKRRGAALTADVAGMPDVMSLPPLPPSPAEVGDLILQTREHVQSLGWGNREQLYAASQVHAVMSECAAMTAARERERGLKELRDAVRQLAALNAWYHFGDCRAWTAGPILSPLEADELARRVLRA